MLKLFLLTQDATK